MKKILIVLAVLACKIIIIKGFYLTGKATAHETPSLAKGSAHFVSETSHLIDNIARAASHDSVDATHHLVNKNIMNFPTENHKGKVIARIYNEIVDKVRLNTKYKDCRNCWLSIAHLADYYRDPTVLAAATSLFYLYHYENELGFVDKEDSYKVDIIETLSKEQIISLYGNDGVFGLIRGGNFHFLNTVLEIISRHLSCPSDIKANTQEGQTFPAKGC